MHSFINEMCENGKRWVPIFETELGNMAGQQADAFDRELSHGRSLIARTVLLGCRGLGTVHAQTIRPDDLTVLMARDLIGDLAQALSKHGIKLELYFHPGHDDLEWWRRTHFDDDNDKYFDLWCKVIGQVGEQYGLSIAGYWFDDATFTYYPFNAPWPKMTAAAKQGNADRLITYNSWILPKVSDFYEVVAGENDFCAEMISGFAFLPVGGTGKFTGGPQSGLQGQITTIISGDWGHFKVNTPISPPRYSPDTMIAKIWTRSASEMFHIRRRSLPGRKGFT